MSIGSCYISIEVVAFLHPTRDTIMIITRMIIIIVRLCTRLLMYAAVGDDSVSVCVHYLLLCCHFRYVRPKQMTITHLPGNGH